MNVKIGVAAKKARAGAGIECKSRIALARSTSAQRISIMKSKACIKHQKRAEEAEYQISPASAKSLSVRKRLSCAGYEMAKAASIESGVSSPEGIGGKAASNKLLN